ncbi:MAG: efflux RND transporter periplasmic adaptor subunit [Usitatibacter sp.]
MKRSNAILLAAGAVAAAALVGWALQPRPIAVESAAVTRGPFEQTVSDDGRTRVRDRYTISAPLAGRVERIALRAGDAVERDGTIAWLAPATPPLLDARTARELQERVGAAEAQQLRAQAEKARIEAQRDQARADYERQVRLAKEGFVSATAKEQAELALRTAERAVEGAVFAEHAASHDLAQARAALARYRQGGEGDPKWKVSSPVKGVVLKVLQESEAVVAIGAPLAEVADARSLEAIVDILSQDAVAIRPGMLARVELGQGVAPLAARVRLVEPAAFTKVSALGVEEQRVNVVLDFTEPLDRVQTLGDGFRVEAHIVTHRVEDGTKVPVGALFREGERWSVFVVEDGRAAKRPVKVVLRNGLEALVENGVKPGERVVVYPSDALADGSRVDVRAGPQNNR